MKTNVDGTTGGWLLDLLRARHDEPRNGNSRAWVYAEEVRVAPGWRDYQRDAEMVDAIRAGAEQRLDAFALHTWPSEKWRRVAYEVKTSTADLRRELAQPAKCAAALALSNEFYLVAGPDVKVPAELPPGWGVMVIQGGRLTITRKAPFRDVPLPPYSFMLSLARNLQAEAERGTAPLLEAASTTSGDSRQDDQPIAGPPPTS